MVATLSLLVLGSIIGLESVEVSGSAEIEACLTPDYEATSVASVSMVRGIETASPSNENSWLLNGVISSKDDFAFALEARVLSSNVCAAVSRLDATIDLYPESSQSDVVFTFSAGNKYFAVLADLDGMVWLGSGTQGGILTYPSCELSTTALGSLHGLDGVNDLFEDMPFDSYYNNWLQMRSFLAGGDLNSWEVITETPVGSQTSINIELLNNIWNNELTFRLSGDNYDFSCTFGDSFDAGTDIKLNMSPDWDNESWGVTQICLEADCDPNFNSPTQQTSTPSWTPSSTPSSTPSIAPINSPTSDYEFCLVPTDPFESDLAAVFLKRGEITSETTGENSWLLNGDIDNEHDLTFGLEVRLFSSPLCLTVQKFEATFDIYKHDGIVDDEDVLYTISSGEKYFSIINDLDGLVHNDIDAFGGILTYPACQLSSTSFPTFSGDGKNDPNSLFDNIDASSNLIENFHNVRDALAGGDRSNWISQSEDRVGPIGDKTSITISVENDVLNNLLTFSFSSDSDYYYTCTFGDSFDANNDILISLTPDWTGETWGVTNVCMQLDCDNQ